MMRSSERVLQKASVQPLLKEWLWIEEGNVCAGVVRSSKKGALRNCRERERNFLSWEGRGGSSLRRGRGIVPFSQEGDRPFMFSKG